MIAKIFGVYIVEKQGVGVVRVMLMENTMQLENKNNLKHIFDLKGSSLNRLVTGKIKPNTVLKDINLVNLGGPKVFQLEQYRAEIVS
jgi:hypothetical protein